MGVDRFVPVPEESWLWDIVIVLLEASIGLLVSVCVSDVPTILPVGLATEATVPSGLSNTSSNPALSALNACSLVKLPSGC